MAWTEDLIMSFRQFTILVKKRYNNLVSKHIAAGGKNMRKVLMLIATVVVTLIAGHAAAADQPMFTVTSFNAPQGDSHAASISSQALPADHRLVATASPFISPQGDLMATVSFHFSSMDIQNQWRAAGWPGFVDGVEVYLLGSGMLPAATVIWKGVRDASGIPVWSFAHVFTGDWSSVPGVYTPYLTALNSNISGLSGSVTVVIASKQMLDMLPESPKDSSDIVNYNYGAYIIFDPIDVQQNFAADGRLTPGSDGTFKYQGLMFFGRKVNGIFELYSGN